METCRRFEEKKCRLPVFDLKTGIKTKQKHFLAFKTSQPIRLYGFGMYGPMTIKELKIKYGLLIDDFCNPSNHKTILASNEKTIQFDGHRQIVPLMFCEPITIQRYEKYILYLNTDEYKTYRGVHGQPIVRARNLKFIFLSDFDGISETKLLQGNFPELYFDRCIYSKPQRSVH